MDTFPAHKFENYWVTKEMADTIEVATGADAIAHGAFGVRYDEHLDQVWIVVGGPNANGSGCRIVMSAKDADDLRLLLEAALVDVVASRVPGFPPLTYTDLTLEFHNDGQVA